MFGRSINIFFFNFFFYFNFFQGLLIYVQNI